MAYWVQVNNSIAPFLTITDVEYFTFGNGHPPPATLPYSFTTIAGADPGFMSTYAANGGPTNLGVTTDMVIPNGSYHVTDITFALATNAPIGTFSLRTTTNFERASGQVTTTFSNFGFPQASFVFTVVPEPSTLALIGLTGVAAAVMAYRRRK